MSRFMSDVLRIGFLLVVVGAILLYVDVANVVVLQALGIALFFAGGTHLTRRILFPRLDLQHIAIESVKDANTAGAIIVLAVVLFLIAVMLVPVFILR